MAMFEHCSEGFTLVTVRTPLMEMVHSRTPRHGQYLLDNHSFTVLETSVVRMSGYSGITINCYGHEQFHAPCRPVEWFWLQAE